METLTVAKDIARYACGLTVTAASLYTRYKHHVVDMAVVNGDVPAFRVGKYRLVSFGVEPVVNTFVAIYNYYRKLLEDRLSGASSRRYALRCNMFGGNRCAFLGPILNELCGVEIIETRKGRRYIVDRDCRLPPVVEYIRKKITYVRNPWLIVDACPKARVVLNHLLS